jgi:hypothetical protein
MKKVEPLPFRTHLACVVGVVMLVSPLLAEPHTQAIATQVAAQLDAQMLDAFAAEDPNDAGRFIAAIYVGEHILAISAVHPAPASVRQDIAAGNYRQVYSVLSTSANKEGRLFGTYWERRACVRLENPMSPSISRGETRRTKRRLTATGVHRTSPRLNTAIDSRQTNGSTRKCFKCLTSRCRTGLACR